MNEILKSILSLSLSGTLLILVWYLLQPFLKKKLSKCWQYYIWLVVIARLLFPIALPINFVGTLFEKIDQNIQQMEEPLLFLSEEPSIKWAENGSTRDTFDHLSDLQDEEALRSQDGLWKEGFSFFIQNLWLFWVFIVLLWVIRKITIYQDFVKYIRSGCVAVEDINLLEQFGKILEKHRIKASVDLYTNSLISSPLLIGFFRPCVVLPTIHLSDSDFSYIILHEITHYKRLDMFYKWLVQLVICLHWFNPFVHLMGHEINRMCELSCDEAIIQKLDAQDKRAYGNTLLNAMRIDGSYKDSIISVTFNESKEQIKERLDAIMNFKRRSKQRIFIPFVITLFFVVGATTTGAYAVSTEDSLTTSSLINDRMLYEDGVYYILCDGVEERDKPISIVSDGDIMITLVQKNGYTSVGPFHKSDKIIDEVKKQCESMVEKNYLTQEDALKIIEASTKISFSFPELEDQSKFMGNKTEVSYEEEYARWGIEKRGDIYYYQNQSVRIFMDLRADNSFVKFNYNKKDGDIDLKLVRDENGSIVKVEYLSEEEVLEIWNTLNRSSSDETESLNKEDVPEDVERLTKQEVPSDIQAAIQLCDGEKWYVIEGYGRQYIYYNNLPCNYAYQYEQSKNNVRVIDIEKLSNSYVLLSVPEIPNLTINYNSKPITYTKISVTSP